jgi:hypothetical protein
MFATEQGHHQAATRIKLVPFNAPPRFGRVEEMNKVYLISEEVLRQVLDALGGLQYATQNKEGRVMPEKYHVDAAFAAKETLRAILAKEPNKPVAWLDNEMGYADSHKQFDDDIPLYRKDA